MDFLSLLLSIGLVRSIPGTAADKAESAADEAKTAAEAAETAADQAREHNYGISVDAHKLVIEEPEDGGGGSSDAETITGTDPVIVAQAGHRYKCGEVSTISITPPSSGICDVLFTSGTTAAILTVPNTVKWPEWFDPTSLDTETRYELNIADGYGVVAVWAL